MSGLGNVTAISAGTFHTCALTSAGAVKCWGENYYDQLGDGTTTDRSTPVEVSARQRHRDLRGRLPHLRPDRRRDGEVLGENSDGQLGDGATANSSTPVQVSGLGNVTAIAGGEHSCALTGFGTAKCWGYGRGQLGDGTTTSRPTPVEVSGLGGVPAIAAGGFHTCA